MKKSFIEKCKIKLVLGLNIRACECASADAEFHFERYHNCCMYKTVKPSPSSGKLSTTKLRRLVRSSKFSYPLLKPCFSHLAFLGPLITPQVAFVLFKERREGKILERHILKSAIVIKFISQRICVRCRGNITISRTVHLVLCIYSVQALLLQLLKWFHPVTLYSIYSRRLINDFLVF